MMLNGQNDSCNAFLSIHAGAGGTESCDWASMLLRMYSMWAEKNNFSMETIDLLPGEEAGVKRVATIIKGQFRLWLFKIRDWCPPSGSYITIRF